ncbi:MAG: hypothetical protein IKH04_03780 [Kiritimatiellae bacterium]|nr:hypothetical protein [Kiritimatiellia bacterium]
MNKTKCQLFKAALIAMTMALAPAATAQQAAPRQAPALPGIIQLKSGAEVKGAIRWMPQARKYTISIRKGEQTLTQDIALADVAKVTVQKPERLDALIAAVKAGKGAQAAPHLEAIARQYAMLGWDEPATRWLAKAKLDSGDAAGALALCEAIVKVKPAAAYLGEIAPIYWAALRKTDKKAELTKLLGKAIANGGEEDSAAALIIRGDLLMDEKKPFDALKDGYLRTVLLYERCHEVQPEALYKAAKAFEALSKNADAQKMRDQLRKRYPKSEYAGKL